MESVFFNKKKCNVDTTNTIDCETFINNETAKQNFIKVINEFNVSENGLHEEIVIKDTPKNDTYIIVNNYLNLDSYASDNVTYMHISEFIKLVKMYYTSPFSLTYLHNNYIGFYKIYNI